MERSDIAVGAGPGTEVSTPQTGEPGTGGSEACPSGADGSGTDTSDAARPGMGSGTGAAAGSDPADPSSEQLLDRLSRGQTLALDIIEELLQVPESATDAAVDRALARLGRHLGSDRTYVFRLRGEDRIDNTHEWVAEGIEPMIDRLQDVPKAMAGPWFEAFERNETVEVADVDTLPRGSALASILGMQGIRSLLLVPMRSDGRLRGFAGYDQVRRPRRFLPGEVHLLRSVANAIDRVLNAREARRKEAAAAEALATETARLRSTLVALPDLVLELDAEGRFVDFHAGAITPTALPPEAFLGRRAAEVLPPNVAAVNDRAMREVDAQGHCGVIIYPFDLPGGRRWYSLTGARRAPVATERGETGGGYVFVVRDITQLHTQRHEIERLGEVARRTSSLVVMTDADRRIEWVNAAWEQRTGYSLAEVAGRRPSELLDTAALNPTTRPRLRAALEAGGPARAELRNRDRSGNEYWVEVDIQPLRDPDGRLRGFLSVEMDITARKAQSAALSAAAAEAERARAALVSAVDALSHGFAWYDAEGCLVLCNRLYRDTHPALSGFIRPGRRFRDILRYGLACGLYPEAVGREEAWLAERLAAHARDESEIEVHFADGRWLRVVERATPDGGRVGLCVDITALKDAELRATEERIAAMDASLDGIALTDAEGRFRYTNAAYRALFDAEGEDALQGVDWRSLYAPEDAHWIDTTVCPGLRATGNWRGEVIGRRHDGQPLEAELSLTLRPDGSVLTIARDISARRRADQERARLREDLQLAQRREVIGHLAAGLAHDFNNLLATIGGSAALAGAAADPDHPVQPHLTRIQSATEQAAALVRRMLRLGVRRTRRALIDLRAPLREAADLVGAGLGAELRLRLELPEQPAMAMADASDILQIVLNLALNARDALGSGPGDIVLSLAPASAEALAGPVQAGRIDPAARGRPHWAIGVADTGIGMDPATAERLFRPYVTTKGARGSGLGLAIVAGVVGANDGAVTLRTAPGQGACFTVLWPAGAASPPDPAAPTPPSGAAATVVAPLADREDPASGPASGPAPDPASAPARAPAPAPQASLAGRRVLVVEDSPSLLEVLTAFLEQAGARVAGTTDPIDALEVLREDPRVWDLVITDYDMSPASGADLAAEVHRLAPGLPVILLTALPDWRLRPGGRAAGFAKVLEKPITCEGLTSAARVALTFGPRR